MTATFGIDFGTTNSLITVVGLDPDTGRPVPQPLTTDGRPHPSVVWYGATEPVVGQEAKDRLSNLGLGVFGDIVRSPKMYLGSPTGIPLGGLTRRAVDVVADVIGFLRRDALARGYQKKPFDSAVVTIPVDMLGKARAELRQAAQMAGVRIHQFVHEPFAALYGYLRSLPNFRQAMADLEGRQVLVLDWGGGTIDLTLCQLRNGILTQIANGGSRNLGGDRFDLVIRQLVREKSERNQQGDWLFLHPKAESRLLKACEDAKISLSSRDRTALYIREFFASPGHQRDLRVEIQRSEFEGHVQDLVRAGLQKIDSVLAQAGIGRGAIEYCLAIGGMVSMPAIQEGLREMFGLSRLRLVDNSATIISEGAAWIAHDRVDLQLAKPFELLHADDTYIKLIDAGTRMPCGGETISHPKIDMYCVDPTDGNAKFLFARPKWPDRQDSSDPRDPYTLLTLPIDRYAEPLYERLEVTVSINDDLIAEVRTFSPMRGEEKVERIHDLEFGLSLLGISHEQPAGGQSRSQETKSNQGLVLGWMETAATTEPNKPVRRTRKR